MKNAILYYYGIMPIDIHQINKIYKFYIAKDNYVLYPCKKTYEEIKEIYMLHIEILKSGNYCHQIVLNKNKEILTNINQDNYILLKTFVKNRQITLNDIKVFSNIYINNSVYKKIQRTSWHKLWINKIDYLEYQISQFGKNYPIITESSDYYIGIVETCISLLVNIREETSFMTISHDRINQKYTLFDLYNPINFIIDHRVRDIGEYIKNNILNHNNIVNELNSYITSNNLSEYEIVLLFIRILYPSHYLDLCERIIDKKTQENELIKLLENVEMYEKNIKKIYHYIKRISKIPEIEWLT